MTCFRKVLENADTNNTRMNIFLEIRLSGRCDLVQVILDNKVWLKVLACNIDYIENFLTNYIELKYLTIFVHFKIRN